MATRKHEIERRLLDPQFTGSLEPDTESPILLARRIVAKEKRRLCVLTIATCLAWVAATSAGVGVAAFYFNGVMHNMPFYEYRYAKAH